MGYILDIKELYIFFCQGLQHTMCHVVCKVEKTLTNHYCDNNYYLKYICEFFYKKKKQSSPGINKVDKII